MPTGTVKFFNHEKGFGFLVPDGGGADVFVHIKDARRSGVEQLSEGQKFSYEVIKGRTGQPNAINLKALL